MSISRIVMVLLSVFVAASTACAVPLEEDVGESGQAVTVRYDAARSYTDRVRLLNRLKTDRPLPAGMLDPRDGIVLQTEWQADTRDGSAGPDVIHAQARDGSTLLYGWWPNVNYTLTAWQMLALKMRRGAYKDAEVTGYTASMHACVDAPRFDATSASARSTIDAIVAFYDYVDVVARKGRDGQLGTDALRQAAEAELQRKMWVFHERALDFALARNRDVLGTTGRAAGCSGFGTVMPEGERAFAQGWGVSLVPLLAAVNMSTSAALVRPINNYVLPQSVVTPGDLDLLRGQSTLPASQRAGVALVVRIDQIESRGDGPIRELLEGAGSSQDFRATSQRTQSELIQLLDAFSRAISGSRSADGKSEGEGCILDMQCASGLYCRNDWAFNFVCLPKGNVGEHCWTSDQCASGLSCHWIAAHLQKEGPLYARIPHPARVCNAHGNGSHAHQP